MKEPFLFLSNDPEILTQKLYEKIHQKNRPLRKLVVVPTTLVKESIFKEFSLIDPKVTTGFKVLKLHSAIDYLLRAVSFDDNKMHAFISKQLLALHIEMLITKYKQEGSLENEPSLRRLLDFLSSSKESDFSRKLKEISALLADEFTHLGLYGSRAIEDLFEKQDYQAKIWEDVFSKWDFPYKLFKEGCVTCKEGLEMDLHFFGFTHIPAIFRYFFKKLQPHFLQHFYFLNPCSEYWGDIVSEKKRHYLTDYYKKKSVSPNEIETLDGYLRGRNLLLASFGGSIQKQLNAFLDDFTGLVEEYKNFPCETLLAKVKEDLLCFRSPREEKELLQADDSIQMISAPTKKREVEALFQTLLSLTSGKKMRASDILVLSSDISSYFPYIQEVFLGEDSPFSVEVHDLKISLCGSFFKGLLEVFSLKEKRWEQREIMKLLSIPSFVKKTGFSNDQILRIKEILKQANIRYGFNKEHKEALLGKEEVSPVGTWKYALNKLLLGLVVEETGAVDGYEFYPNSGLQMSDAELVGEFIHLLESLYKEVKIMRSQKKTLPKWLEYLQSFTDRFFEIEEENLLEKSSFSYFSEQMKALYQLEGKAPSVLLGFDTLLQYFKKASAKQSGSFSFGTKEGMTFASLSPGNVTQSKIIAFLGADENSFPREHQEFPLREVSARLMDEFNTAAEDGREALLLSILYAKDHLIFSHTHIDPKDDKPLEQSFLVLEFLKYLEDNFCFPSKTISEGISKKYDMLSFDQSALEQNFSHEVHLLGQTYYGKQNEQKPFFKDLYTNVEIKEHTSSEEIVSIQDLLLFARNPLRFYFNQSLGLYFSDIQNVNEPIEKEFIFSPLDRARLRSEVIQSEIQHSLLSAKEIGKLPEGIFEKIANKEFLDEALELKAAIASFGIEPNDFIQFKMMKDLKERVETKRGFLAPPLTLNVGSTKVMIHGQMDHLTTKGLLHFGKTDTKSMIMLWPKLLIYSLLEIDFPKELLLLNTLKPKELPEDAEELLRSYLGLFLKAKRSPCPLTADFASAALFKGKEGLEECIKKSFSSHPSVQYVDPYMKWISLNQKAFDAETLLQNWQSDLKQVYGPFAKFVGKKVAL